jgi:hypothetical protein
MCPVHMTVPPDGMSGGTVRKGRRGQAAQTWNSETWPAGQPVLAAMVTR